MNPIGFLISLVQTLATILTILLFADILISFVLSPYHPIRLFLDRIIQPLLNPIRRVIPSFGMIDFSPWVLLILIQVVASLLVGLLQNL